MQGQFVRNHVYISVLRFTVPEEENALWMTTDALLQDLGQPVKENQDRSVA
jgi:hypothetical protein